MYLAMTLPKTLLRWGIRTQDNFYIGDYDLVTLSGQYLERRFTIRKNARAVNLLKYNPLLEVALIPYSAVDKTPDYWKRSEHFNGKYEILLNSDHAWMIYLTSRQMAERLIKLRCVGYLDHRADSFWIRPPVHEITHRYIEHVISGARDRSTAHWEETRKKILAEEPDPDVDAYLKRVSDIQKTYDKPSDDYWELLKRWDRKIDRLVQRNQLICCY